jgi:transcriptional regulator with XRE-family HTH domain
LNAYTAFAVMQTVDVKRARERRKWDQQTLASESGVSQSTISRIESGDITNPSNDTVGKLERALKLRRGSLVFGAEALQIAEAS